MILILLYKKAQSDYNIHTSNRYKYFIRIRKLKDSIRKPTAIPI